ncbi:MAG: hypothetical protein NZ870_03730 [bacterium]|nr:hypothetical protein [bacterium]
MLVVFSLIFFLFSKTPHTIVVDGDLSDWHPDELVYLDYENDGAWGLQNQLYKLYLTWDTSNLYLGIEAVVKDGNHIVIYFDTGSPHGLVDTSNILEGSSKWYWSKNHRFKDFRVSYQLHSYQTQWSIPNGHGLFRVVRGIAENLSSQIQIAKIGPDGFAVSSAEIKIPFSALELNKPNARFKIVATLTGGTDQSANRYGSVHDAIPNQNEFDTYTQDWFEPFTIEKFIDVIVDSDGNAVPDSDVSPIRRNLRYILNNSSITIIWDFRNVKENLQYFEVYNSTYIPTFSTYISTTHLNYILLPRPATTSYYFIRPVYNGVSYGISDILEFVPKDIYSDFKSLDYYGYPLRPMKINFRFNGVADSFNLYYRINAGPWFSTGAINYGTGFVDFLIPDAYGMIEYYIKISSIVFPETGYYKTNVVSKYEGVITNNSFFLPGDSRTGIIADVSGVEFGIEELTMDAIVAYDFYTIENEIKKGYVFNKPAKLRIGYDDFDNDGFIDGTLVNENNIAIFRYDRNGLSYIGGVVNKDQNYIEASVQHLSIYAIKENSHQASSSSFLRKVVNPVFLPSNAEVVEFQVDDESKLEFDIFDSSGRKLITVKAKKFWDGKVDGVVVPPGVYIYRLNYSGNIILGSVVVVR